MLFEGLRSSTELCSCCGVLQAGAKEPTHWEPNIFQWSLRIGPATLHRDVALKRRIRQERTPLVFARQILTDLEAMSVNPCTILWDICFR